MCGENYELANEDDFNKGSPPRVRGKRRYYMGLWTGERITPACAGKTASGHFRDYTEKDHPRVCGENTVDSA